MGDRIKTAWEKALERFEERSKNISPEDILRMEYRPEGQKLAGRYLKEPQFKLSAALKQYEGKKRKVVLEAVEETLLSRLALPENEQALQDNRRVMEGLVEIKKNKQFLAPIMGELEHLFQYYIQAREQARESLKRDFSARINSTMQKRGIRLGPGVRVNPERHPQFHEEWAKLLGKVNEKFMPALEQLRQKIRETK